MEVKEELAEDPEVHMVCQVLVDLEALEEVKEEDLAISMVYQEV